MGEKQWQLRIGFLARMAVQINHHRHTIHELKSMAIQEHISLRIDDLKHF